MRKLYKILHITGLGLIIFCTQAWAQIPPPSPPAAAAPLDGFSIFLIGAGAVYGIKKARDNRDD